MAFAQDPEQSPSAGAGADGYISTGHLPASPRVAVLVAEAHERFRSNADGENAQVYPALASVDPDLFGVYVSQPET